MLASLLNLFGCGSKLPADPDQPAFFPASASVFEQHRKELRRVAEELGTNVMEYPEKIRDHGRESVIDALQLLCSWKYINQAELTEIERYTLVLDSLRMEVSNGGFHQYFFNASGDSWDIILWGMQESRDEEGLARFKEVLNVFPNGRPFRNRLHRDRQLRAMGERQWTAFEPFDGAFYEKPFPDREKAWALIFSRLEQFRPAWPGDLERK